MKQQNEQTIKNEVKGETNMENKNVAQETVSEMETISKFTGSNQYDENIAKEIVQGIVNRETIRSEAEKEIEKMKHEANMKLLGISERITERKMELEAKNKMTEKIVEGATWFVSVAGVAAVAGLRINADKEIQLEKIRQGQFD